MRLKIISDGKPFNKKVIDMDTGTELNDVLSVDIQMRPGGTYARVELYCREVEFNGEITEFETCKEPI